MFINRIIQSVVSVLRPRLIVVLVVGALLVALSSPVALAQSVADRFNLRANNTAPTTGELADSMVYLPLVVKNFPFIPGASVLDAISNDDGDGSFAVSWGSSVGADTYTLQEDDNVAFSSPTTVYTGSSTSKAISGRDVGTYYYRVKASNAYASSDWSNIVSVTVTVPLPDCPQTGLWHGDTSQGGGRNIDFVVENSPACQIAAESLRIEFRDGCGANRTTVFNASVPITNNHFDIEGASTHNTFAKNRLSKKGFSSKVDVFQNTNLLRKAHARDCSTFTRHYTTRFQYDFAPDGPCHLWHVGHDTTDHDVRNLTLDRNRWELPHTPTLVSQQRAVVISHVGLVHPTVVAIRS